MSWQVYMVITSCGKLYTGISTDVKRRFQEHQDMFENKKGKGAKFFRGHQPMEVVYMSAYESRSDASKRESQIKKMSAANKQSLILKQKAALS